MENALTVLLTLSTKGHTRQNLNEEQYTYI